MLGAHFDMMKEDGMDQPLSTQQLVAKNLRAYANGEVNRLDRDTAKLAAEYLGRAPSPEVRAILDEREVKALAKKSGLPKYMWDTEEGRMALAHFAYQAARLSPQGERSK